MLVVCLSFGKNEQVRDAFVMVKEMAQSHLVTFGMYSFTFVANMTSLSLWKAGYVSFFVKYQLYLLYETDIDIIY